MSGTAVLEREAPEVPPAPSRRETAARLAALIVGTALFVAAIWTLGGLPWVAVVFSILLIITLHELGHFATAKWSGMKATEFFVGFGPRLWSIRKGETEYGVKALPLGGYVKILGMTSAEELDPSDEPRSFVNQSTSKRVLVASAGSIVHVLIALGLAFAVLFWWGLPGPGKVEIAALTKVPGLSVTPAQAAGLKVGDVVVSINGQQTTSDNVASQIQGSNGAALRILVLRHGHRVTLVATPRHLSPADQSFKLGIGYATVAAARSRPGLFGSVTGAGHLVWVVTQGTAGAFVHAFSPSGLGTLAHQVTNYQAGQTAAANGQGTVSMLGAGVLAADAFNAGLVQFMGILIALNISLAVLNMLPMLPLDGGHVAIALYERARSRRGRPRYRADVTKLMPVIYAFLAFLLMFVASKMYLDIAHGVRNPFG